MIIYEYSSIKTFSMENIALVERIISITIISLVGKLGVKVEVERE